MTFFDFKGNQPWARDLTIVMQLGLTMAGCVVFCFFVGRWLDDLLGLSGILTTVFILLGVAGGAVVCYRQIMELFDQDKNDSTPANKDKAKSIKDDE
ncbi:MAG: AtpZ/AtpI family protein [Desulfatibacillaceae bacterium]|nr:AtpZ/AtpI family protein [Desulfatibacillaceae bacterium]